MEIFLWKQFQGWERLYGADIFKMGFYWLLFHLYLNNLLFYLSQVSWGSKFLFDKKSKTNLHVFPRVNNKNYDCNNSKLFCFPLIYQNNRKIKFHKYRVTINNKFPHTCRQYCSFFSLFNDFFTLNQKNTFSLLNWFSVRLYFRLMGKLDLGKDWFWRYFVGKGIKFLVAHTFFEVFFFF